MEEKHGVILLLPESRCQLLLSGAAAPSSPKNGSPATNFSADGKQLLACTDWAGRDQITPEPHKEQHRAVI